MKKILTHLYNRIFNRNKRLLVWNDTAEYKAKWTDVGGSDKGNFHYYIYYYPYRNNKYVIDYNPVSYKFFPADRFYATEHPFYKHVLNKLQEFQQSELIDLITLPKIEGVKQ